MKKFAWIAVCVLLLVSLAACKKTPYEIVDPDSQSGTSQSEMPGESGDDVSNGQEEDNATGSTTPSDSQPGEETDEGDNVVSFDWGDEGSTTTQKNSSDKTTTKKPTTTTTTAPVGVKVFPKKGDKPHDSLQLTQVDINGTKGSMTVKNVAVSLESDQSDYLLYTCYDKNGKNLGDVQINIGRLNPNQEIMVPFTIPANTVQMLLTKAKVEMWTHGWV